MAGHVKTIEIVPSRVVGKIRVVSPYSQALIYEGTIDEVKDYLVSAYKLTANAASDLIRKGREVRGIWKGIGYIARFDAQAI